MGFGFGRPAQRNQSDRQGAAVFGLIAVESQRGPVVIQRGGGLAGVHGGFAQLELGARAAVPRIVIRSGGDPRHDAHHEHDGYGGDENTPRGLERGTTENG
jgi:hypothetical protein